MRYSFLLIFVAALSACLSWPTQTHAQLIRTAAGNGGFGYSGDGGAATSSVVNGPYGVGVDKNGNLYIADNERIRVVNMQSNAITVATVPIQPGDIQTVAGNGTEGYAGDSGPATSAELDSPRGVAIDSAGNIFIADWGNGRVRMVNASGIITTITGNGLGSDSGDNGPASQAYLNPYAVALDSNANVYIADTAYLRIRVVNRGGTALQVGGVTIPSGDIATVAGNGILGASGDNGPATSAEFNYPYGIAVDAAGNIYICDTYNREIRVVNAGASPITIAGVIIAPGYIQTVAGNANYGFRGDGFAATQAEFADPDGVSLDANGNIFVSDLENARIRRIDKTTGIIGTIAGTGVWSYNSDGVPAITAQINEPRTTAVDASGNVYIADEANSRVREVSVTPGVPVFTSRAGTAFTVGVSGSFLVTTTDLPIASLQATMLPDGIYFVDHGDGTGTLSGTPSSTTGSPFTITLTAMNGVSPNAVQQFALAVYSPGGAPMASFLGIDSATQGNWQGIYGADGYSLANVTPQSIPGYATFSVQSQVNYTWVAGSTDVRALNVPGGASRTAAAWYSNTIFTLDVNMGASVHPFALYAVDWDGLGRSELVQVLDANTGSLLDSETISNFTGGVYLSWNLSGHVQIMVFPIGAPNGVVSAVFFGGDSTLSSPILNIAKKHSGTFVQGQQSVQYTLTVSNLVNAAPTNGSVTVTEIPPSGLTLVSMSGSNWTCPPNGKTCSRSDPLNGGASYPAITVTMSVAANASSPQVNQASVSGGGNAGTVSASDSATIAPESSVAQATYVGADKTTQGNWQGVYGADGDAIADVATEIIPPYATFGGTGESSYTWITGISDLRALLSDNAGHRIASAWYSASNFTLTVSTDGNLHQIGLYLLDWDNQGRSESIQLIDTNSGAVLDTRNLPDSNTGTTAANFLGGTYLIWDISGNVTIKVTMLHGPNAVVSGIFFDPVVQSPPQITSASSAAFTVGTPGSFTVTATGSPAPTISASGSLPDGVTFNTTTGILSGTSQPGSAGPYTIFLNATNGVLPAGSQTFQLTVNPQVVTSGPSASFVSVDTSTEGNWMGAYGADGYDIAGGPDVPSNGLLSYGSFAVQGQSLWTWAASTTDKRALETDTSGGRMAATWYSGSSFIFDVNFTDTSAHQVALYVLDWDAKGRGETIQITDAENPGTILDTRRIPDTNTGTSSTNFANGTYLVWSVSGHVTVMLTTTAGPNAVAAGIFFGGAGTVTPPATATAVWSASDVTTKGAWMGKYGSLGYSLANSIQNFITPATFEVVNSPAPWTWAQNPVPADPRDLQTDSSGHQIAAAWYSGSSFQIDLNLTDGSVHQLALYVLDWDQKGRAETITISDANSGAMLDTRGIPNANSGTSGTNFEGGTYLIWNISGHVSINVTANSSPNGVVSGIFLQ